MSIKLGIVGTNFIAIVSGMRCSMFRKWKCAPCIHVVRRPEMHLRKNTGIEQVYTDYELFLNSDLDAVYIATPTYAHCPQTLQALEQGKHVLCEKIMAVNAKEVEQMMECAKKNEVVSFGSNASGIRSGISVDHGQPSENRKVTPSDMEYCQYSSRYDKFRQGEILNAFRPELANGASWILGYIRSICLCKCLECRKR